MYPNQPVQVRVPLTVEAYGQTVGADLVARVGQFGIYSYSVLRVWIDGPIGTFQVYKGSTSNPPFSSVASPGVTDGQFQPGETIPAGTDVIGVWVGGAGSSGRMVITTDGGF